MRQVLAIVLCFLLFPTIASANNVIINQIMVHPLVGNDWVEILNPRSTEVDLNNWVISDGKSAIKTLTGILNAQSTLHIDVSNRLNNSGDSIYLIDSAAMVIDSFSYTADPGIDVILQPQTSPSPSPSPQASSISSPSPESQTTPSPKPIPTTQLVVPSLPSPLDIHQEITFAFTITNFKPNDLYYLKGSFHKLGSTNYFGETFVKGSWIKNNASYTQQLPITTDITGSWQGIMSVRGDPDDSGYTGPGDYFFRIGYYRQGLSVIWSADTPVIFTTPIKASPLPTPKATSTKSSQPSPKPSPIPSSSTLASPLLKLPASIITKPSSLTTFAHIPNLLGMEASSSASQSAYPFTESYSSSSFPSWIQIGGWGCLVVGFGLISFFVKQKLIYY